MNNIEKSEPITFPCTGCGCCCKRINIAVQNYPQLNPEHPLYFPYSWNETGRCENLTPDNKCAVYEHRPLLCDIERFAAYFNLDKAKFFAKNIKTCNLLMDVDNVDPSFRIR
jgi:Fe-S-cluster containining protein